MAPISRKRAGPRHAIAEHERRAPIGAQQAEHQSDGRRLAGAVRAQEPEDLPLLDPEGEIVDSGTSAEAFGQSLDFDHSAGLLEVRICLEKSPISRKFSLCKDCSP